MVAGTSKLEERFVRRDHNENDRHGDLLRVAGNGRAHLQTRKSRGLAPEFIPEEARHHLETYELQGKHFSLPSHSLASR
eukprot:761101-Hanusia_phi.AAC.1